MNSSLDLNFKWISIQSGFGLCNDSAAMESRLAETTFFAFILRCIVVSYGFLYLRVSRTSERNEEEALLGNINEAMDVGNCYRFLFKRDVFGDLVHWQNLVFRFKVEDFTCSVTLILWKAIAIKKQF